MAAVRMHDGARLSKRADKLEQNLGLLNRLTSEAGALLDVLGSGVFQLTELTAPIHARASALTIAQANIAAAKKAADELLEHLDTSRRVQLVLEQGPGRDLNAFLDALQQLERSNTFLQAHSSLSAVRQALNHSQAVAAGALAACDSDFRSTLATGTKACAPTAAWLLKHSQERITGENAAALALPLVPSQMLPKLQRMATLLLDAHHNAALAGYADARSRALETSLRASGKETPPLATLQALPTDQLDKVVQNWAGQLRMLALLLLSERRLANDLWKAPHNDTLLAQAVGPHLTALAAAGRDIMDARRTSDRVFSFLDMHQQLDSTLPALTLSLGDAKPCKTLVAELTALRSAIAAAAGTLSKEYEESVARDASKVVVADGTIHPVCAQVLNYVKRLLAHSYAQAVLCGDSSSLIASRRSLAGISSGGSSRSSSSGITHGSSSGGSSNGRAAMAQAVGRILERLVENLGAKAKAYKNDALGALFMMNNVHYMTWSVEHSTGSGGAFELLGRDWVEKRKDLVEEYGAKYHDLTWTPLVKLLQAGMPPESDGMRLKAALKERYTRFNEMLERICASQSGWTIPDPVLKAAVKRVVKDELIQPYQDFLRRYAEVQFTQNPAKYIKYATADVAALVDDELFESKTPATGVQGSKLSILRKAERLESFT